MNIKEIPTREVLDFTDFIACTSEFPPRKFWVYRGQPQEYLFPGTDERELRPKAGRAQYTGGVEWLVKYDEPMEAYDMKRFLWWRKEAVAYGPPLPQNDFDCLAFAQHYGLATRFLDWSLNPLVALFFAVETDHDHAGVIYCHATSAALVSKHLSEPISHVCFYRPPPFDRRILAQQGVFTYHPDPAKNFPVNMMMSMLENNSKEFCDLVALTIPADAKPRLIRQLSDFGVTRKALFPDLDGLSAYVNWESVHDFVRVMHATGP